MEKAEIKDFKVSDDLISVAEDADETPDFILIPKDKSSTKKI